MNRGAIGVDCRVKRISCSSQLLILFAGNYAASDQLAITFDLDLAPFCLGDVFSEICLGLLFQGQVL